MAKYAVGVFASGTSSTHNLRVAPTLALGVAGSTSTAAVGVSDISFGGTTSTGAEASGGYLVARQGTSEAVAAIGLTQFAGLGSTGGGLGPTGVRGLTTAVIEFGGTINRPVAFALVGGSDVQAYADQTTATTLTSVAGSTQASSAYGFTPNAAFVTGWESSIGAFSFGFACVDSAGSRSQWCISQNASTGASASVSRSASTASVLKLNTTASTAFDVAVTSFRGDGIELTVAASDTARVGRCIVQALSVPRIRAGRAAASTNGAGSGVTGINVTGLGSNVAMVVLASIASSVQTLQSGNRFSVGFATSNGDQFSVSGNVANGGTDDAAHRSNLSADRAVTFLDTAGVLTQGLFAVTTDGFTVSFDNTNANTWDMYWAAFSNIPVEMESHVISSFAASANPEKEFETARGRVAGDATIETRADDGALRWYSKTENTTSPDIAQDFTVTTTPQRLGLASYQNAKHVTIIPPSTNTHPYRIAGSRQSQGVAASSQGANTFPVPEDHNADLWVFTTQTSATIAGLRVLLR